MKFSSTTSEARASSLISACPSGFAMSMASDFLPRLAAKIIGGVAARAVRLGNEWRTPPPGIVAFARSFDFDDLRAQIGQHLARPGPGQHAREIENPNMA